MDISKERFGQLLKSWLDSKGVSQREMARRIGTCESAVSEWANGKSYPATSYFLKACDALDLTPDEFLELPGTDRKVKIVEVESPRPEAETTEWLKDDEGIWFCRRCRSDAPYDRTGFQHRTDTCPWCGRTVKHPVKKEEN